MAFLLPARGISLTLGGYFGLLFAAYNFKNSGWALPAVFALTGFVGCSLGPACGRAVQDIGVMESMVSSRGAVRVQRS